MKRSASSNTALFRTCGNGNQADLSTLEDAARSAPWLSGAQPDARRPRRVAQSSRAGSSAARVVAVAKAVQKRFGLDATRRLGRKTGFERLLRGGIRRSLAGYTFYYERRGAGRPRLGILISRKHAAAATERNRIKRCIREAFRLEQESLGAVDVLVRPPYGARGSAQMIRSLRQLFVQLRP